jgi:hypothetical protein
VVTVKNCAYGERVNLLTNPCSCELVKCDPCFEEKPDVFLATSDKSTYKNSIWVVKEFAPGVRTAKFVCRFLNDGNTGPSGSLSTGRFIGDIAFLWSGELMTMDTNGVVGYTPLGTATTGWTFWSNNPITGTPSSTDLADRVCTFSRIGAITNPSGDGWTGLTGGYDSRDYWLSTGRGRVVNVRLSQAGSGGPITQLARSIDFFFDPNPYNVSVAPTPAMGQGGTDVVAGPTGLTTKGIYRWVSANSPAITTAGTVGPNMQYTGTRHVITAVDNTATGAGVATNLDFNYVSWGVSASNGLYQGDINGVTVTNQARDSFKNAGAFCTSKAVYGTAFCNPERCDINGNNCVNTNNICARTSGEVARFFQFGVRDSSGTPTPVAGLGVGNNPFPDVTIPNPLPAPVYSASFDTSTSNGFTVPPTAVESANVFIDVNPRVPIFIIGAATKPSCPQTPVT